MPPERPKCRQPVRREWLTRTLLPSREAMSGLGTGANSLKLLLRGASGERPGNDLEQPGASGSVRGSSWSIRRASGALPGASGATSWLPPRGGAAQERFGLPKGAAPPIPPYIAFCVTKATQNWPVVRVLLKKHAFVKRPKVTWGSGGPREGGWVCQIPP